MFWFLIREWWFIVDHQIRPHDSGRLWRSEQIRGEAILVGITVKSVNTYLSRYNPKYVDVLASVFTHKTCQAHYQSVVQMLAPVWEHPAKFRLTFPMIQVQFLERKVLKCNFLPSQVLFFIIQAQICDFSQQDDDQSLFQIYDLVRIQSTVRTLQKKSWNIALFEQDARLAIILWGYCEPEWKMTFQWRCLHF